MLRYARKIAVKDLQYGMYVEALDRPWLETDFELEGIYIQSDADIERVRSVADFVFISTMGELELSDSQPEARAVSTRSAQDAADRQPRAFKQELRKARIIRNDAKSVVETMQADAKAGRAIDTHSAREVVIQMMASVARNPDALVWFTNLKNRDAYTAEHSMNVCMHAIALATHVGESEDDIREMGVGALLHDVGKIRVPKAVLNKPGKLTDNEFAEMRRHPEYGYEILENASNLSKGSLEIVIAHHERLNGFGYPRKLSGAQISHYSQLVAITDVYDAITSDRIYQDGRSPAQALRIMRDTPGEFNARLLGQFVEQLGAYPIGSLVELNTGEVGFIVPTMERKARPTVLIVLDHKKRRYFPQRMRDLMRFPKFEIVRLLATGAYGIDVDDYAEWFE